MAVKRFLLDTSQLNDATTGLDGGLAFILDTSTLDSDRILDGGEFLTTATGTATLGAISATASATVKHSAVLSSTLGAISATASATVKHSAVLSSTLGALDASAQAKAKKSATASADLGALDASATTKVAKTVIATADLGALDASATTKVAKSAIASADLGGLVATANALDTPPTPTPEPTPVGGRQYAAPRRPKKIEPLPEVEIPVIQPKRRYAVCSTSLGGMTAQAEAMITFSILDDDAEVLLLV
jgi:hypothetical protein